MKYLSLSISIIITIFIFSMSLLPGSDSSDLSSGLTVYLKQVLDFIFTGNNISQDSLHLFTRKAAHVSEYLILGVSYYYTAKHWKLSALKIILIGILTASLDELLQTIPIDRYASAIDIFVFDLGGFVIGFGFMLLIFNRKSNFISNQNIFNQLEENKISSRKAYNLLYRQDEYIPFTRRAHFIKLNINIPDEKGVNKFLKVLFFLPIPLFIVNFAFLFYDPSKDENIPFTKQEILDIVHSKKIKVKVNSSDNVKVTIKTI